MKLQLPRFRTGNDASLGTLFIDGENECFTLEDGARAVKVKGETRIPEGTYEIKFREVVSGLTEKYRAKYPWFKWHLELQDVPGFQYVYIHVGNLDEHTDGCILVGDEAHADNMVIYKSAQAFRRVYRKVANALNRGEKVEIVIQNFG